MLRPRTLKGRLAIWYAGVLAVTMVAFGAASYLAFVSEESKEGALDEEDEAEIAQVGGKVLAAVAIGLPIALAVAAGGGWWIGRRALRPIDDVVRVAGALDADDLSARVPHDRGDAQEVQRLVTAFNGMLERIEHSVGGLRRFTADASHELRTPLAVMMGELEVALRRPRDSAELRATMEGALEELGRLARLVDSLLTLARADAGELPLERVPLDAGDVVRRVVDPYETVAAERGLALEIACPAPAPVSTDPLWLGRAVANLVDNACKFTPRGGRVSVAVTHAGDQIRIEVADSGPGITGDDRERAFERFYRARAVRGSTEGFGIGLPLARDIARALGGDLTLDAPPAGGGARFHLDLPAVSQ